jgi:aromatic-L-amino-acid decarboxylase
MQPAELEKMIQADLAAGLRPFCVVPTVGTTSTSSIDPVRAAADIAHKHGMWLHVDAAYAGPVAILEEYRSILDGAALADSLVLNPHKWLFTPMDLSILYLRRPDIMRQAVSLTEIPPYLKTAVQDRAVNLADYSVNLGRRFRSLKLWFVLRYFGREGIEEVLRNHMKFAQDFAAEVAKDSRFELSAPVPFSLVCFRYRGTDEQNHRILNELNASGYAFLSATQLHGKAVLRLAIGNLGTRWEDVEGTWRRIQQLADEL